MIGVNQARSYSPQVGDQITVTTTVKYDEDGHRENQTQTVVIKRADGSQLRY